MWGGDLLPQATKSAFTDAPGHYAPPASWVAGWHRKSPAAEASSFVHLYVKAEGTWWACPPAAIQARGLAALSCGLCLGGFSGFSLFLSQLGCRLKSEISGIAYNLYLGDNGLLAKKFSLKMKIKRTEELPLAQWPFSGLFSR